MQPSTKSDPLRFLMHGETTLGKRLRHKRTHTHHTKQRISQNPPEMPRGAREIGELGVVAEVELLQRGAGCDRRTGAGKWMQRLDKR
jgi:hypothetical protein